jgi:hypothetical protein
MQNCTQAATGSGSSAMVKFYESGMNAKFLGQVTDCSIRRNILCNGYPVLHKDR